MKVQILPSLASGTLEVPPSKSDAHRAIICAAIAGNSSEVTNIDFSDDILATIGCLESLGAVIEKSENSITVRTSVKHGESAVLECRESGSTLRFLIPLASQLYNSCVFTGSERLFERPLSVYENIFDNSGIVYQKTNNSFYISGKMRPGKFTVPGNISSQFISGLLFALPLLDGDSVIEIIPPFESRDYVYMTLSALNRFGIQINLLNGSTFEIKGNSHYSPASYRVEGDWSNAAFLDAFNYLGGSVNLTGLNENSNQGDKIYRQFFSLMNASYAEINLSDYPDLGPVCMALAYRNGAEFSGVKRLRLKESDRCAAMAHELVKFGIKTKSDDDTFTVYPSEIQAPNEEIDSHNDHRIVMAMSLLCSVTGGTIDGAQTVSKSFPGFFDCLTKLGIKVNLYETA